jgi:hypothetical protein
MCATALARCSRRCRRAFWSLGQFRIRPKLRRRISEKQGENGGGAGNRTRGENTRETLEFTPDRGPGEEAESSSVSTVRGEPRPAETAAKNESGPTDAELEAAIVRAVMLGAVDVAKALADRLEARRMGANVIALRAGKPRSA